MADTKVFTPSGGAENTVNNEVEVSKPSENSYLDVEDWNDAVQAPNQQTAAVINMQTCINLLYLIFIYFLFF